MNDASQSAAGLPPATLGWRWAMWLPLATLVALYGPLFPKLVAVWNSDPNFSHGFLVPLVSGAFAWQIARDKRVPLVVEPIESKRVYEGTFQLLFGLALHLAMWFTNNLFMDVLSLVIVLRGMLLLFGGKTASAEYGFPVLFLMFMAPLPIHWYQPIAVRMQQFVSDVSSFVLTLLGVPVYQEGYYLFVPGYTMEVAEACSGLRQLVAILALGVAIGHLSGRGRLFRWVLGLAALPIAVVANCIRVVISGLILIALGPKWAEGVFHTLEGLVIIAISALLLVALAWLLARVEDRWNAGHPTMATAEP